MINIKWRLHTQSNQNVNAIKQLKKLLIAKSFSCNDNKRTVLNALQILNKIDKSQEADAINLFFKICLKFKQPHKALAVWQDVEEADVRIMYSLLFKCCIECNDTNKTMMLLEWMKSRKYRTRTTNESKDFSMSLTNMIRKFGKQNDVESIKRICRILSEMTDSSICNLIWTDDSLMQRTLFVLAFCCYKSAIHYC